MDEPEKDPAEILTATLAQDMDLVEVKTKKFPIIGYPKEPRQYKSDKPGSRLTAADLRYLPPPTL
jgi:hypothetical protein